MHWKPHLRQCVADAHQSVWVSTEGLDDILETGRGSLPGDPLGDEIFNHLMALLLREVAESLKRDGVVE